MKIKRGVITIDFETRSEIDLKANGRKNYMDDKNFEIILAAVKIDDAETNVYTKPSKELLQEILNMAECFDSVKLAHNAPFEINALEALQIDTGLNDEKVTWRDTMVMCQYYGLPYSLENAGKYLKLRNTKLTIGKDLIELFTKPIPEKVKIKQGLPASKIFWEPEDFPEKWLAFCEYCKQDVDVCYEIFQSLPEIPYHVWKEWRLNLNINRKGILVDKDFCKIATQDLAEEAEASMLELKHITGLDNPGSRAQLKVWFKDFSNLTIESLNKNVIAELLESDKIDKVTRRVLELFSVVSKTSTAKYQKFLELMNNENKVYDILNFYGGRTGRWSSWGVQLHNMKRINLSNYEELRDEAKSRLLPMFYNGLSNIYSQLIRTAIIARPNNKLIIADFAQIEARVLQWLAGNKDALEVFKSGKDYYTYTAAIMFKKKYEDIPKDSEERRKGKIASLALGYGGAVGALDRGAGADMTKSDKLSLVKLWRSVNKSITKFWEILNAAFIKAYITKEEVVINVAEDDVLTFGYTTIAAKPTVWVELPSKRRMYYPDVRVNGKNYVFYGKSSEDQFSETYVKVYGGFLAENITQAIARDCLQEFMNRLKDNNYSILFHVHDEVIVEFPMNTEKELNEALLEIENLSRTEIYKGLPVVAEPKASDYYDK